MHGNVAFRGAVLAEFAVEFLVATIENIHLGEGEVGIAVELAIVATKCFEKGRSSFGAKFAVNNDAQPIAKTSGKKILLKRFEIRGSRYVAGTSNMATLEFVLEAGVQDQDIVVEVTIRLGIDQFDQLEEETIKAVRNE